MASSARQASRGERSTRAKRTDGSARGRFRLLTPFSGEGVPAQIMGPRLLVVVSAMALTILGLVMVYSASSIEAITENGDSTYYLVRQVGFAAVGLAAIFLCVKFVPYHEWLNRVGIFYYLICMVLVVLTAVMGLVGLGAQRWVSIAGITLQPSEFAKIALLLATTRFMLEWQSGETDTKSFVIRMALFVLVPLAFIFKMQSDLGTTAICLVGILTILWVGELPLRAFGGLLLLVVVFGALASTVGYRQDRFIFMDPWSDYYGSGFQIIHSFYAFAQGGLFGTGLGNSAEKYLYLPEAETDFIFSIIGEELGMVGALAVVALFLAFLIGGLRMAQTASDEAGRLMCSSMTVMLVFQAFLNMGMCVGLLPTTGKPLPFISAGGSSLIASLLIVGIMLSVSYSTDDSAYARKRENLRLLHVEDDDGRAVRGSAPAACWTAFRCPWASARIPFVRPLRRAAVRIGAEAARGVPMGNAARDVRPVRPTRTVPNDAPRVRGATAVLCAIAMPAKGAAAAPPTAAGAVHAGRTASAPAIAIGPAAAATCIS